LAALFEYDTSLGSNTVLGNGEWFNELLTPPAVASLLGVSPPTVYAAIQRDGQSLGHIRTPGNQIRVRRREVLAYCHRMGFEVPSGLVPRRSSVVVLHPDRAVGLRVSDLLEPDCQVEVFTDDIEGLIAIGSLMPPQILISERFGRVLVKRLCMAIRDMSELGYMSVILLIRRDEPKWSGGVVPLPLRHREPRSVEDEDLRHVVRRLLGLG
jgi:excisionase family DNA binding protein